MTEIALRPSSGMMTLPEVLPMLARALAECVPSVMPPMPAGDGSGEVVGHYLAGRSPTDDEREAARAELASMAAAPGITAERLAAWLKPFAILPNAPPGEAGRLSFAAIAALALNGVPAAALTQRAWGEGLARWEFWPSPKQIRDLLAAPGTEWNRRRSALLAIIAARPSWPLPPPIPERTPEEVAAVREAVEIIRAELPAEPAPVVRVTALPLHGEALRMARAAVGRRSAHG